MVARCEWGQLEPFASRDGVQMWTHELGEVGWWCWRGQNCRCRWITGAQQKSWSLTSTAVGRSTE